MNENKMLGLAWISPYIIGLIVFTAFPFVSSFFLSFTEYDLMSPPVFNGIENYRYMLTEDGLFWKSMGVTFAYVFLTIPLKLAFALGIAFVLNFKLRVSAFSAPLITFRRFSVARSRLPSCGARCLLSTAC
ncbi:binding-protein-dependent transport system inner membrane protein [Raoultella ornithinolytica]|nr:binding-protein-dependent transport system inner membrane protein [Raoultella ornithinolytica]